MPSKKVLLSCDWDYFVPRWYEATPDWQEEHGGARAWSLWDWSAKESQLYINGPLWPIRANAFERAGVELPTTTGQQRWFWPRFRLAKNARLYVAESHASIMDLVEGDYTEVWSYDAHHDGGYDYSTPSQADLLNRTYWACDNWAAGYTANGARVNVRYPEWSNNLEDERSAWVHLYRKPDLAGDGPRLAHDVFVCRSGAWTPPWLDGEFNDFIAAAGREPVVLDGDWIDPLVPREMPDLTFETQDAFAAVAAAGAE